jgi:hypothetical protein
LREPSWLFGRIGENFFGRLAFFGNIIAQEVHNSPNCLKLSTYIRCGRAGGRGSEVINCGSKQKTVVDDFSIQFPELIHRRIEHGGWQHAAKVVGYGVAEVSLIGAELRNAVDATCDGCKDAVE